MSDIGSAAVGAAGALVTAYCATFVAEEYRRFRDGSALAAALAGELASHALALPILLQLIDAAIAQVRAGQYRPIRSIPDITDPVFDLGVGKLGLLGPELAENVVFVYQQIRAFRFGFSTIAKYEDMQSPELLVRFSACRETIERAQQRGEPAIAALRARAAERFSAGRRLWKLLTP